LSLLNVNGKYILVGAPSKPIQFGAFDVVLRRKQFVGSLIGGIKETQEMLDFCAEKKVFCEVEVIKPEQINEAYERCIKGDVRYRFCIDVSHM
jgi:uncharacterized zinc-type alcohol dehydrogenase-like protein